MDYARSHLDTVDGTAAIKAVSTVTPRYPQTVLELPDFATDSSAAVGAAAIARSRTRSPAARTRKPGIGPDDLSLAEVYDLSTALELDWYENIGLCGEGEAEAAPPLRRHRHRRPHPGQPERRARLLRRGHPGPGHRPGVRGHVAAPGPGRWPPGRRGHGRHHRQPGTVRTRLVGDRRNVTDRDRSRAERRATRWPRPTSSTQCAPRWAPRRRALAGAPRRPRRPLHQGAGRAYRHRPRPRSRTWCSATSTPSARRPVTSPARAGSSPGLPGARARHHHRPPVRLGATGRPLRRAGRDERHQGPRRRRRRAEHEP